MEYKIITVYGCPEFENVYEKLETSVNEKMKEGWKPQGGICVIKSTIPCDVSSDNWIEVWQSMIKETNNE